MNERKTQLLLQHHVFFGKVLLSLAEIYKNQIQINENYANQMAK